MILVGVWVSVVGWCCGLGGGRDEVVYVVCLVMLCCNVV